MLPYRARILLLLLVPLLQLPLLFLLLLLLFLFLLYLFFFLLLALLLLLLIPLPSHPTLPSFFANLPISFTLTTTRFAKVQTHQLYHIGLEKIHIPPG